VLIVPVTLALVFLLLFLHFRNAAQTLIVMSTLPFALVGGIWLLWLLGFNTSVAVWVGFIALAGLAAEMGVVMLIYLDRPSTATCWSAARRWATDLSPRRSRARPTACARC
jgi:copper/silver efflux system protein